MDLQHILEKKVQDLQYSTVNKPELNNSTVQYSTQEARARIESLDDRLYRNSQFLPFYVSALRKLGWSRILDLQSMILNDPRLGKSTEVFNPEKVFCALLRDEIAEKALKD